MACLCLRGLPVVRFRGAPCLTTPPLMLRCPEDLHEYR